MRTLRNSTTALFIAGALAASASGQPVVTMVLNRASYTAVVAPNCWVIITGYNFASASFNVQGAPLLPTTLGGASVTVGGLPTPLLSVTPNEITALIPPDATIPQNTVMPLTVTTATGGATYNIRLTRNAPSVFTRTDGSGRALVFDSKFRQVDTVGPQDTVIFYATGLGPTDSSGRVVDPVEVYIGDQKAQVLFAGLAPGLPGIYQVNATASAPATDRLYIRTGGWQSNIVTVGIRGGANTSNVRGTINGLNPSSSPGYPKTAQRSCIDDEDEGPCGPQGFSESLPVVLHAGTFSVSFDVVPGAAPFFVAAVGEAGGSLISINPSAGTYTASITTAAPAAAQGDFSNSIVPLWDYLSCDWKSAVCQQFPNSNVPPSRLLPFWISTLQLMSVPAMTPSTSPNGLLEVSGSYSGSHFVVDGQNNNAVSTFGGFVQNPYGPFAAGASTFKLYVDGKLIASETLPYLLFQRAPMSYQPDDI